MKPIEKCEAYLVGRGIIFIIDAYANRQIERLRRYPYDVHNPTFTRGMFSEFNTNRIQVYVSDDVKYFL